MDRDVDNKVLTKLISDATLATAGTVATMVAGLVIMPHLIAVMGSGIYGLWALIAGLAVYLGILDFGVTAAVYRLSARSRAGENGDAINELMSTSVALLALLGLVLCVLTGVAQQVFLRIFTVPADAVVDVVEALWVVGLSVAVTVPLEAFTGLLWAYERFEVLNGVTILSAAARAALVLIYVGPERPLVHVALISAAVGIAGGITKVVLCYRLAPGLKVSLGLIRGSRARELFAFGKWMNLLAITKALLPQIVAALIAKLLSAGALTTFAVARQLVFYTNDFTNSATQVVAPRAARLDASGDLVAQQSMLVDGGRVSYALALFFFGGYVALGAPFIHVWQRGTQDAAYILLVILMAGEIAPTSQWVTYSQIVGALRQRALGYLSLCEALLVTVVCFLTLPRFGLVGAAIGIAAVACLVRGMLRGWYGCRLLRLGIGSYLKRVFLSVSLRAAMPIIAAVLVAQWVHPDGWVGVLGLGTAYALIFAAIVGLPLLGARRLMALTGSVAQLRR